jgi:hypothetical protein
MKKMADGFITMGDNLLNISEGLSTFYAKSEMMVADIPIDQVELDNILYDVKKHLECNMDRYLRFIGENEKFFDRTKNQMISYWNCYYRLRYPNKESYIGFNIFNNLEMAYNKRLSLP